MTFVEYEGKTKLVSRAQYASPKRSKPSWKWGWSKELLKLGIVSTSICNPFNNLYHQAVRHRDRAGGFFLLFFEEMENKKASCTLGWNCCIFYNFRVGNAK